MKKTQIFMATLLGLSLTAPLAFADSWSDAQRDLQRWQQEYNKDRRQLDEAHRRGDRQGVRNEEREIHQDRAKIAEAGARVEALRRSRNYGYGRYDRNVRYDRYDRRQGSGEWRDAREDLRRAEAELQKDHGQYLENRRRGDRHGMELEAREMQKDRAEIAKQRARLNALQARW